MPIGPISSEPPDFISPSGGPTGEPGKFKAVYEPTAQEFNDYINFLEKSTGIPKDFLEHVREEGNTWPGPYARYTAVQTIIQHYPTESSNACNGLIKEQEDSWGGDILTVNREGCAQGDKPSCAMVDRITKVILPGLENLKNIKDPFDRYIAFIWFSP